MRCDIYVRLSRDRDDQTSTTRQLRDCTRLAEARDWEIAVVHEDVDFSAYRKGIRRPAYEALQERVRARETDVVIFWKIDRLSRNLREFLRFVVEAEEHGVALVSVNEQFDTGSAIGRAIMQLLAVFAELESATIGMRVRSAREYAAMQGTPSPGGRRAFGYTADAKLSPCEADAIRRAAQQVLAGGSGYSVALEWNAAGLLTVTGKQWSASQVLRMLRNPVLAGLRVYRGEVIGEGSWEPILDRETHEALTSRRGRQGVKRRVNLLSGLLTCEGCGGRMVGHRSHGKRFYMCPKGPPYTGCGRTITAEPAEAWITELTLAALDRPEVQSALSSPADDGALQALSALEMRMADLGEDYAAGLVPRPAFRAASELLQAESAAIHARLARAGGQRAIGGGMRAADAWAEHDVAWRAAVVDAVFERIGVAEGRPGGRFDQGRLHPVPRE